MKVEQLMTSPARVCGPNEPLSRAAQIMWEADCGCVPVVDAEGKAVAMITDRDICMAGFTQNRLLSQIPVSSAASRTLATVHSDDSAETAEDIMRKHQIRRVPVVDAGGRPVGILSVNDLARHAGHRRRDLGVDTFTRTLAAICEPTPRAAAAE